MQAFSMLQFAQCKLRRILD